MPALFCTAASSQGLRRIVRQEAALLHENVSLAVVAALCDSCMLFRPRALWHADADEARRAPPHPTPRHPTTARSPFAI